MAVISSLSVSLKANTKPLSKGLTKAKRQVKKFSKSVVNMKSAVIGALGIGGIGAVMSSSLTAWKAQEMAVASLDSSIGSMGRTSANLSTELQSLANQLQGEGIIGDEAIIQGQSFLSTFSQISDKMLPRATRAMVDLMAKTGTSGQSAANMIGKAAMGLTGALRIAGITLSSTTEDAAKANKEMQAWAKKSGVDISGLNMEAKLFGMILTDIESQIGGTNAALGKTDSGAFIQLGNALGDVKELLGKIIAKGAGKWVRQLTIDIRESKVNVDDLAKSFSTWLTESTLAIAPFVNAFKGIQLVVKGLEIGFKGFATGFIAQIKIVADALNFIPGLFGAEAIDTRLLDETFSSLSMNLDKTKEEFSALADEISNQTFSRSLEEKLKEFDKRAEATAKGLTETKPIINPKATGGIDKLILNPGRANEKVLIESPQINRTNEILMNVERKLNFNNYAVAG